MFHRLLKLLFAGLVVALFAVAAWERFRLPLTPHSDPDIWCYFNPSLSKLLGGPFKHTYGQCFLYPGLIYIVLAVCGDYRAVTLVQHLLGLGTGALLLVAWGQVRGFFPRPRLPRFLFGVSGLAMAGMYLFSSTSLRFEHTLRPEAVFPFFAVLNICNNLAFIRRRFFAGADQGPGAHLDWRTLVVGAGTVFTCVMTWLLKPSFSAMLLLANLPVILSLWLPGSCWRDKLALALASTLAPGLLLVLPEWQLRQSDRSAHSFLSASLFTIHARLICDQMADDLAHQHAAPYDPQWLGEVQARLAQEIQTSVKAGRPLPSLGYDPDYLKLQTSFHGWLEAQMIDRERAAEFYDDYYRRTWRGRPLAMGRKIWRQMAVFYRFDSCSAYVTYRDFDLQAEYARSAGIFHPGAPPFDALHPQPRSNRAVVNRYPPAREYLARCGLLAQRPDVVTVDPWVEPAAALLSKTYFGLCLWALAVGAASWLLPPVRRWGGSAAGMLLLLYAYNFGTTLSLSIGHSMDIGRYGMYQLAYTLLPQGLSAWLALEAVLAVGAFLLVRVQRVSAAQLQRWDAEHAKPVFAARPEPLPVAVRPAPQAAPAVPPPPADPEVVLGLLVRGRLSEEEKTPWLARYRQAFPDARLFSWDVAADAAEMRDCDVLLAIDGDDPATHDVEAARRLVLSYRDAPADLITAVSPARRRRVEPLAWLSRFAAGVTPDDFRPGLRLLSRRFYRGILFRLGHDHPSAREEAMATAVQVAGRQFLIRDLPVAEVPALPARGDEPRPSAAERWRRGARLFALCCRCRPGRSLGAVAGVWLLLAMGFAPFSMHHRPHARRRYMVRRAPMVVTGLSTAAAVASLATGSVIALKRHRWRVAVVRRATGPGSD